MFAESQAGFFRAAEAGAAPRPLAHLADGARFAGTRYDEPLLGTLRPGAPADLVVLDYPAPTPLTTDNLGGHWIFGLSAAHVRDVYVAGDLVVAGHRSTRVDEAKIAADSRQVTEALWDRLESIPAHDFTPRGGGRP
jgi:cytosine/adenosine deaminase-related metal-dependent hydrolase